MNYFKRLGFALFWPHKAFRSLAYEGIKYEDFIFPLILVGLFKMRGESYIAVASMPGDFLAGFSQLVRSAVIGFFPTLAIIIALAVLVRSLSKLKLSWEQAAAGAGYAFLPYALLVFIGSLFNRFEIVSPYFASAHFTGGYGNLFLKLITHYLLFGVYASVLLSSVRKPSLKKDLHAPPKWITAGSLVAFLALPLASLALDASLIRKHYDEIRPLMAGDEAEEFALKDMEGKTIRLSEFRGKAVLLNFFAVWCPVCNRMEPTIKEIYTKYNNKGLVVLGINTETDTEREELLEHIHNKEMNYPVLQKRSRSLQAYRVRTLPTFIMIDKEGKVSNIYIGYTSSISLERGVKKALGL